MTGNPPGFRPGLITSPLHGDRTMDKPLTPEEEGLLDDLCTVWTRIGYLMADNPLHRGLERTIESLVSLIDRVEGRRAKAKWYRRIPGLRIVVGWIVFVIHRIHRGYVLYLCKRHLTPFDPDLAISAEAAVRRFFVWFEAFPLALTPSSN